MNEVPDRKWIDVDFSESRDLDRILDLRSRVFSDSSYDRKRWQWQYQQNPSGAPYIELAVSRTEPSILAGHYALLPQNLLRRGQSVLACQSLDTFTHPDFAKQGIFKALAEKTYDRAQKRQVGLIFGFPNAESLPGFTRSLGFHSPFELKPLQLPLHAGFYLRRIPGLKNLSHLGHFLQLTKKTQPLIEVLSPTQEWADLARQALADFWAVDRPIPYWQWRYRDCPDRKYQFLELRTEGRSGGKLQAVAVTRLSTHGGPGHLVDFVADAPSAMRDLIQGAAHGLAERGAESVVTLVHDAHVWRPLFAELGFQVRRSSGRFIVRALQESLLSDDLLTPSAWYLTPGDTDFF